MKSQEVVVVVNDIKSNGIISLEKNVILIDMGITKQVIDFRDISIYDKKSKTTLGLILKNNKSIDLIFKDYLLLYKLIDDFMKNQVKNTNTESIKCPECETINKIGSAECSNCGFPFKKTKVKKEKKNVGLNRKTTIILVSIIAVVIFSTIGTIHYLNTNDNTTEESNEQESYINVDDNFSELNKGDANIVNNRSKAEHVFSDIGKTEAGSNLSFYIILGYENKNYECADILGGISCWEVEYTKNGNSITLTRTTSDGSIVKTNCVESLKGLKCDGNDNEYIREK